MRNLSLPPPLHTQTRHDLHGRHPRASTVRDSQRNLAHVRHRIDTACRRMFPDLTVTKNLKMGGIFLHGVALEEDATVARVDQVIYGTRTLPDNHFRPVPAPSTERTFP